MRFIWLQILPFLLLPGMAQAQPAEPFHITGHAVHAETDPAEICLTLSHPMAIADRTAMVAHLQLEKNGVKAPIALHDLSLTPTEFCIQQLQYKTPYHLTVTDLQSLDDQTLAEPYSLNFTLPDRKAALNFAPAMATSGMLRYLPLTSTAKANDKRPYMPIILQATNVATAQLTLYRIADHNNFAAAYQQFAQASLAPSESLTYAREHGAQIWQNKLAFDPARNILQTLPVPLPDSGTLTPGLYFLAAAPVTNAAVNPATIVGQWFLVSELKLNAATSGGWRTCFCQQQSNQPPHGRCRVTIAGQRWPCAGGR